MMPDTSPDHAAPESGAEMPAADRYLDAKGLYCPEPIMLLHQVMAEITAGQVVKVIATDPSTERDLPKFCQFLGHHLAGRQRVGDEFHYWIEKHA